MVNMSGDDDICPNLEILSDLPEFGSSNFTLILMECKMEIQCFPTLQWDTQDFGLGR